ncbi:glycosyltransferase family 4 protein [Patescibacteria group bacterium]
MKIIFLNKYQNKVSRGAETFVNELSKRLAIENEVEVISKINYMKLLFSNFDVIVPINGRLQVFLVRLISLIKGAKMIVSGQSGMGLDDRVNLYAFPDVFVAISSKAKEWAKTINPLVKTVYIPNGVDLNKFNNKGSKIKIYLKPPIILYVGAIDKQKRVDLAVKAVSKLKKGSLVLVGRGKWEKTIQKLGEKMLPGRFKMMSFLHRDMPKVYKSADLFTFPTVSWESFGIVLVEAMASGLPVVTNNDQIRKGIVGQAGEFVDPTDTDLYADKIEKSLKKDWGDKPRKQAEKFDWDKIAKEYEALCKSLL